jgi:hypothetical protein
MMRVGGVLHTETLCNGATIVVLSAGPLDEGIAVLLESCASGEEGAGPVPIMAGFWVQGKTIYTVNPSAREITLDLPEAPEAIIFERLRDVVH